MSASWLTLVRGSPYWREDRCPSVGPRLATKSSWWLLLHPPCSGARLPPVLQTRTVCPPTPQPHHPAWRASGPSSFQNPAHCSRTKAPPSSKSPACPSRQKVSALLWTYCSLSYSLSTSVLVITFSLRALSPSVQLIFHGIQHSFLNLIVAQ